MPRPRSRGEQWRDGRTGRWVVINGYLFLYADEARQVAAQLLAAADEMDAAPMKIDVQVIAENAANLVTVVSPGPRETCSCGWIGTARWTVNGARIDAELRRDDTSHGLADALVLDS